MRTLIVCLLVAGCSTSSDHTKACKDNANASCARLASCSASDLARRYGTIDVCQTRQAQVCLNSFTAPQNSNTDTRVESCAATYPTEDCTVYLSGVVGDACLPNMGPRADGDPCGFSGQCQSSFCAIPTGSNCGTCAELPAVGDDCSSLGCGSRGLVCAPDSTCAQPGAANDACNNTDTPCGQGLSCVGATASDNGTCQPELTTSGAACDARRRTAADCSRDTGLYCNAQGQCAAVATAGDGMPCGQVGGVVTLCTFGACFGASGTTPGICKTGAADGAACDTINGPDCQVPARCVGSEDADGGTSGICTLAGTTSCG